MLPRVPGTHHTLCRGEKDLSTLKHSKWTAHEGNIHHGLAGSSRPIPIYPAPWWPEEALLLKVPNVLKLQPDPEVSLDPWEGGLRIYSKDQKQEI